MKQGPATLFPHVNTAYILSCSLPTLCLKVTLPCVDFMDVIMGDIPPANISRAILEFYTGVAPDGSFLRTTVFRPAFGGDHCTAWTNSPIKTSQLPVARRCWLSRETIRTESAYLPCLPQNDNLVSKGIICFAAAILTCCPICQVGCTLLGLWLLGKDCYRQHKISGGQERHGKPTRASKRLGVSDLDSLDSK